MHIKEKKILWHFVEIIFCYEKSKRSAEEKNCQNKNKRKSRVQTNHKSQNAMELEENQSAKEGTSSTNEENTYITFSEDIVQLVNSGGQVCLNIIFRYYLF